MLRIKSVMVAGLVLMAIFATVDRVEAGDFWRNSPLNAHLRFWSAGVGAGYHAGNGWHRVGHRYAKQPQCAWDDTPCDVAQGLGFQAEYWPGMRQPQPHYYSPNQPDWNTTQPEFRSPAVPVPRNR